jgi:glucose-6-phosphate dehydrogenase assembly protein OpcA
MAVRTIFATEGEVPVALQDVERELARQMRVHTQDWDAPVHRARMSNLVIFCNSRLKAAEIDAQLPDIVAVHPARVLLLVGEPGPDSPEVSASVVVRAQRLGSYQQCCSEQVTLTASGCTVDRLPFAVRSLVIGDLPTNLWWAANVPPPMAGILLRELAENAQQVMYDSLGWDEPARGVAATAGWLEQVERETRDGRWRVASDVNWRRLKYWRRLVGQALDPASAPGAQDSITELLVEHGPEAVIQAWELASWVASRLGWQVLTGRVQPRVEITWRFQAEHGDLRVRICRLDEGAPEIHRVRIACTLQDRPAALDLVAENPQRLAIRPEGVEGAPRTMTVPPHSPAEIIGRQLSDREPDPVFHESMAVAQVLARSLLA